MSERTKWKIYSAWCRTRYSIKSFGLRVRIALKRCEARVLKYTIDKIKEDR